MRTAPDMVSPDGFASSALKPGALIRSKMTSSVERMVRQLSASFLAASPNMSQLRHSTACLLSGRGFDLFALVVELVLDHFLYTGLVRTDHLLRWKQDIKVVILDHISP
uniref:Uncharacterized protein n=1 Tax=Noccaea caerulescens TaxID=107243 RepID=A0A1J3IM23_NOCCA